MARLPRLYAPSVVQHVVQRAAEGRALFVDADDYALFLDWLRDAVREHGVAVHAFALLPDRIELVATPQTRESIPRALQSVARRYVPRINAKAGRGGTLWRARYRSTLVDDEYLLAVMRYVESSPVAEGRADTPADWRWSSYAHHAGHAPHALIVDHAAYWALSDTPFERQAAYRGATEQTMDPVLAARIRDAVTLGWALGSDRFIDAMGVTANRRPTRAPRGRPRK